MFFQNVGIYGYVRITWFFLYGLFFYVHTEFGHGLYLVKRPTCSHLGQVVKYVFTRMEDDILFGRPSTALRLGHFSSHILVWLLSISIQNYVISRTYLLLKF
jgi:hypothetical protein